MSESTLLLMLLAFIGACLFMLTLILYLTTQDLRRLFQQMSAVVPACNKAFREAQEALAQARSLLTRTNRASQHVEQAIHKTCDTASELLEPLIVLKGKAQDFLEERFGNGARVRPRRHSNGRK